MAYKEPIRTKRISKKTPDGEWTTHETPDGDIVTFDPYPTLFGYGVGFGHSFVDEHGRPVRRTKHSHPYSYDGYVLLRAGPNSQANNTVYSDRLEQWDYKKTFDLWEKHCKGYRYSNVPLPKLQDFIRDWIDDPEAKVILLMEYCNQSSGYPVWRIDYHSKPKTA